jgi:CheY-like chemotaxis protein
MEAIGRLAGGIAHDFNNMLTAILGNVQLISMHMEDDEDQERLLGEIRTAARRSADLTRQLLAFSRKQALEPERIDLNAMIDRMEPILDRMIGEPIAVLTSLDPDLGTIEADPSQIDQVVMNLVVNARDAMPEGGTLTIETANVHLDESYAQLHADGEPGDYVMLSISDTGVGMDQETQEHIFEPFFTTKGEEEGTGLGLATVYGIVSQSGGHIHVYSEPGEGSVFKVYLPLMGADARPEAREEGADNILTGGETVLLVEDEDIVRDLIAGVLRRHGHEVVTAPDGQEALEVAEEHEGTIDIVVTDVVMPEMNGGQLAEALSETGYDIPVLFISGYTDNTIVQHGVLEGGVHYLQKPFDPEKLLRRIRSILDEEE